MNPGADTVREPGSPERDGRGAGRRTLSLALAILAIAACERRRPPTEAERVGVLNWLTCVECTENERSIVVDTLGPTIIPLLDQALAGLDSSYRSNAAWGFGADWAQLPTPTVPKATYVAHFMANFDATVQRRAAIALGELGAVDILAEAIAARALRGYRQDVVDVIQRSRDLALSSQGGPPLAGDHVEVFPDSASIEVGESGLLAATVLDVANVPLPLPVTWSSSNSAVVSVSPAGDRSAQITGVAQGTATVTATASGTADATAVTVIGTAAGAYLMTIQSGNLQRAPVNQTLATPFVVRVTDANGTELSGIQVTWTVRYGGGIFVSTGQSTATTITSQFGLSSVQFRLGPGLGRVGINAAVTGASRRFTVWAVQ